MCVLDSPAVAPPAVHSWQAQRGLASECSTISVLSLRCWSSRSSPAVGMWNEVDGRLFPLRLIGGSLGVM